ncbi:hypothetical protein BM1_10608 [Bipolaris maydis]|nr:hypothetical protein BM1_10608 [Bipolaris maydis]
MTMNSQQVCFLLEMMLDGFVDMIDQGKVLAVEDSWDGEQEQHVLEKWVQMFEEGTWQVDRSGVMGSVLVDRNTEMKTAPSKTKLSPAINRLRHCVV